MPRGSGKGLIFAACATCLLFPTEVIRTLFGEAYVTGVPTMQLLGAAYLFLRLSEFIGLRLGGFRFCDQRHLFPRPFLSVLLCSPVLCQDLLI